MLFPAVRQVRVTAARAAIYAEPSRSSSRIDIVSKGTLLSLFQEQKVKEVWFYVSYISPRYGGRMSGFILDSAAEPVIEGEAAGGQPGSSPPKTEPEAKAKQPGAEPAKPVAAQAPAAPARVEPKPATAVVPKPDIPREKPRVLEYSEAVVVTAAPRALRVSLPRRPLELRDDPWTVIHPISSPPPAAVAPKAQPKIVEYSVVTMITRAPRATRVSLPRRPVTLQDKPWAILQPPAPEPVKPAAVPVTSTPTAAPKPEITKEKPKPSPPAPQVQPPPSARMPVAGGGSARLAIGVGFGPSFGGAGGTLQLYLSRSVTLHGGYGVYPTTVVYSETDWVKNEPLWSAGLRFYLMPSSDTFTPYVDAQYGGLRVEAAQVITGIYEYEYTYSYEQKVLWGPSLLAGLELRFGHFTLGGGIGASYSLTDWDVLKSRVFFTFEAGLGVRL